MDSVSDPHGSIIIDPEFRSLIPPLEEDERDQLEANLLAEGCRDALVIWLEEDILLDGHNRLEICRAYDIEFRTVAVSFPDRDSAKAWVLRNQLGRRNLALFVRIELVLKLEPLIEVIKAQAKERQRGGQGGVLLVQNSAQASSGKTRDEIARLAGVSHDTVAKAKVIAAQAPESVKDQLRRGETSINAVYREIRGNEPSSNGHPADPESGQADLFDDDDDVEEEEDGLEDASTAGSESSEDESDAVPVPADPWSESELERRDQVEQGFTVLANQRCDHRLIAWARAEGLYVPIDRTAYPLGNPMRMDDGHDRAVVIEWYRDHWLSFHRDQIAWSDLVGKVLGCWCYPEPCHGSVIIGNLRTEDPEGES